MTRWRNAVGFVVLREETRDQAFSHTSFPLQGQVDSGVAADDLWFFNDE